MEEEYLNSMTDAEQGMLDRMALANDLNFGMTPTNPEGSNVDLLWGMLMGFLLGAIMLFLVSVGEGLLRGVDGLVVVGPIAAEAAEDWYPGRSRLQSLHWFHADVAVSFRRWWIQVIHHTVH